MFGWFHEITTFPEELPTSFDPAVASARAGTKSSNPFHLVVMIS